MGRFVNDIGFYLVYLLFVLTEVEGRFIDGFADACHSGNLIIFLIFSCSFV